MGEMMSSLQPFKQVSRAWTGCPQPGDAAAADWVFAEGKSFVQLGVWDV